MTEEYFQAPAVPENTTGVTDSHLEALRPNIDDVRTFTNIATESFAKSDVPRVNSGSFLSTSDQDDMKITARKTYNSLASAASEVAAKVEKAARDIDSVLVNGELYPDGRKAIAGQLAAASEAEINESLSNLEARAQIAEATLQAAVMPPEPRKDAASLARADAQTFVTDAESFAEAAAGNDDLAALLLSPWGARFARKIGAPDAHQNARAAKIQSEARNGNEYARAYLNVRPAISGVLAGIQNASVVATGRGRKGGR